VKHGTRGFLTEINNKLNDLQNGDVLFPPDAHAASALEVVPVHDDVDHQIEGDGNPRDGGVADKLGITKKSRCSMVVCVEES